MASNTSNTSNIELKSYFYKRNGFIHVVFGGSIVIGTTTNHNDPRQLVDQVNRQLGGGLLFYHKNTIRYKKGGRIEMKMCVRLAEFYQRAFLENLAYNEEAFVFKMKEGENVKEKIIIHLETDFEPIIQALEEDNLDDQEAEVISSPVEEKDEPKTVEPEVEDKSGPTYASKATSDPSSNKTEETQDAEMDLEKVPMNVSRVLEILEEVEVLRKSVAELQGKNEKLENENKDLHQICDDFISQEFGDTDFLEAKSLKAVEDAHFANAAEVNELKEKNEMLNEQITYALDPLRGHTPVSFEVVSN